MLRDMSLSVGVYFADFPYDSRKYYLSYDAVIVCIINADILAAL